MKGPAQEEVDPLDAFMDTLYKENKELIETNNLHIVKSQTAYREELKNQFEEQQESIQKTSKEMGFKNEPMVKPKGIRGTKFVKGESLFKGEEIQNKEGQNGGKGSQYVLGSDFRDLDNVQKLQKVNKNKWNISAFFKQYYSKRDGSLLR